MKKLLLFFTCIVLYSAFAFCQTKTTATSKKPLHELAKLLIGSALPYKIVNDSLAVIAYEGENIASYNVVIQKISDLYIIYTNLSEALPGKINESKYKYLLQQNDHYDMVKIGISADDGAVYIRADLYRTATNPALLKRIITQVANVTNIISGELK
jgi:hypothetical protein